MKTGELPIAGAVTKFEVRTSAGATGMVLVTIVVSSRRIGSVGSDLSQRICRV